MRGSHFSRWILTGAVLTVAVGLYAFQGNRLARLQEVNRGLESENRELAKLRTEVEEARRLKVDQSELERLRAMSDEVQRLRGHYVELKQLRQDHAALGSNFLALQRSLSQAQANSQIGNVVPPAPSLPAAAMPPPDERRGAWLGVAIGPVAGAAPGAPGVALVQILENSPAARAGLKEADIITAINGKEVASVQELRTELLGKGPGAILALDLVRQGRPMKIAILSSAWPQ